MKNWSANTWVLAIFGLILGLAGIDVARNMIQGYKPPAEAEAPPPSSQPPFKVGDAAPDFTLPDSTGKKQSLASLVNKDTLLMFICGCSTCKELQADMTPVLKKQGPKAPQVISVASFAPEAEKAY